MLAMCISYLITNFMYDFIIAGAGTYGKIMAFLLRGQGFKTLLIEKKSIKKTKLENIVITNNTYIKLSQLLNIDLSKFINKKISEIHFNNINIDTNVMVLNLEKLELHLIELYKKVDKTYERVSKVDFDILTGEFSLKDLDILTDNVYALKLTSTAFDLHNIFPASCKADRNILLQGFLLPNSLKIRFAL